MCVCVVHCVDYLCVVCVVVMVASDVGRDTMGAASFVAREARPGLSVSVSVTVHLFVSHISVQLQT